MIISCCYKAYKQVVASHVASLCASTFHLVTWGSIFTQSKHTNVNLQKLQQVMQCYMSSAHKWFTSYTTVIAPIIKGKKRRKKEEEREKKKGKESNTRSCMFVHLHFAVPDNIATKSCSYNSMKSTFVQYPTVQLQLSLFNYNKHELTRQGYSKINNPLDWKDVMGSHLSRILSNFELSKRSC